MTSSQPRTSTRPDFLHIGQKMSNVFYNIKQDERVPEGWRKWAEMLQTEWDAAIDQERKLPKPRKL